MYREHRGATAASISHPSIRRRFIAFASVYRVCAVALLGSATLLGGCASFATWEPPDVTLADLELTELTAFETTARLSVRLVNPNREALLVEGASYGLFVDGLKVGQAVSSEVIDLPGLSSAVQEATLHLSNLALATRLQSVFASRSFDYEIRGRVHVFLDSGSRSRRLRVQHAGRFELEQP